MINSTSNDGPLFNLDAMKDMTLNGSTHTAGTMESILDLHMQAQDDKNEGIVQGCPSFVRNHHTMLPRRSILKQCSEEDLYIDVRKISRRAGSMPDIATKRSTSFSSSSCDHHDDVTVATAPESPVPSSPGGRRRSVEFGSIEIHEHGLVLGDHPDCSYGPPIQLGWNCLDKTIQHVDDYELTRGPRRHKNNLAINYYERKNLLKNEAGLTEDEIKEATKKVSKDKMRRNVTKTLSPFYRIEGAVESSKRKVKRAIGGGR